MSFNPTKISDDFSSSPQIEVEDLAIIASHGFKTILNCRPDNEGGAAQPTSTQLKISAEQHGMQYFHFPVAMGAANGQVDQNAAQALAVAQKPILGFCKSGMRASNFYRTAIGTPGKKTLLAWLQSKCLITRLLRWCKNRQRANTCCK
jgi:uncharacterized protein (TIGR01244 family)